jgi:16S rRNA (guanine527-N7)-methyltransferase
VSTVDERIAVLIERYGLGAGATTGLEALLEQLASDPHAPTTVREPERAVDEHIADSLVGLELDQVRVAVKVLDIGAGAGFPGLPLAIALPRADFVLVDGNARKCAFIERAIAAAAVHNARAMHARVEELAPGEFDLVTARAVAALAVLAEYAAPLLALDGWLVAWRGRRDPDGERDAAAAAEVLGLEVHEPVHVQPFPGAEHRYLHLMLKVRDTPARFPRRPGIALKRPLGAESRAPSDRPQR